MNPFVVEKALEALARGGFIVVADDEDRENEGDLIASADLITDEIVNLFARDGRGLICAALPPVIASRLGLSRVPASGPPALHGTAFTESVDWVHGTTTGISCADRAATLRGLASPVSRPDDFARPGHVFPLIADAGGVLSRRGHTEATVDLCTLAGLSGVGVLCEILREDGSMARGDDLRRLAERLHCPFLTVTDVVAYRSQRVSFVSGGMV